MASPARIAKHPIHPMLVPFPIGLFVFSFIADLVHLSGRASPVWNDLAYYTLAGGIVGALLAALPGLVDFLSLKDPKAWRIAATHMSLNLLIVAMYGANLWLRTYRPTSAPLPIWLSATTVLLLVVSGWLGGEMVYVHGVGVQSPPEARRETEIRTEGREHARSA